MSGNLSASPEEFAAEAFPQPKVLFPLPSKQILLCTEHPRIFISEWRQKGQQWSRVWEINPLGILNPFCQGQKQESTRAVPLPCFWLHSPDNPLPANQTAPFFSFFLLYSIWPKIGVTKSLLKIGALVAWDPKRQLRARGVNRSCCWAVQNPQQSAENPVREKCNKSRLQGSQ